MFVNEFTSPIAQGFEGCEGFMFLGDTHLASGRVGRRIDDYAAAGVDKLKQAAKICRDRRLYPIHLGDLFHRAKENDLPLLSRTMAVMREFPVPPLVVAGSHDRHETWFTDKDAAQILADAGVIHLLEMPGQVLSLNFLGKKARLWVNPAGCSLPASIEEDPEAFTIMVTHQDFDFKGPYPGCHLLQEVVGCQMLVNGHMHTPTPVVNRGMTACHNPGSIMRVAVDQRHQEPAVSVWRPENGQSLERVPLKYVVDVFDLTGKEVYAADPKELKASLPKGLRLSAFAAKLRGTEAMESARSDDGSVMVEELVGYFEMFEKPENLKRYLTVLLNEVIQDKLGVTA